MDRIESAVRRYGRIVSNAKEGENPLSKGQIRELRDWFQDDVVQLLSGFITRMKFQETASWSLRAFRPGADTDARRQVDAVAKALTRHACLLRTALKSKKVSDALEKFAPPLYFDDSDVEISAAGTKTISHSRRETPRLPFMTAQIGGIAEPFWTDLVSLADYLEPTSGWLERVPSSPNITAGEFVVSLNPELHGIGDFVVRCLFRRVGVNLAILKDYDRTVLTCTNSIGGKTPSVVLKLPEDYCRLQEAVQQLHAVCSQDPEAELRDSMVILTQVYTALHPSPDVGWLGLDDRILSHGRTNLNYRLLNPRDLELADRVSAALLDLKRLYANEPPGQSELEEAVAKGGLVLAMSSQTVFWNGAALSVDWTKYSQRWKLLAELVRKGRIGADVEDHHIYTDGSSGSAMGTLFGRLKSLLPPDLRKNIVPGRSPRSYRLELDAEQITVLDRPA
jgi:hypothetical protein